MRNAGSVGILLPNLEARLVIDGDGDGNEDAVEGQPGEVMLIFWPFVVFSLIYT